MMQRHLWTPSHSGNLAGARSKQIVCYTKNDQYLTSYSPNSANRWPYSLGMGFQSLSQESHWQRDPQQ